MSFDFEAIITISNQFFQSCKQDNQCIGLSSLAVLLLLAELFFIGLFVFQLIKQLIGKVKRLGEQCKLSQKVDKELGRKRIKLFFSKIRFLASQFYLPTFVSTLMVIIISVILFLIARIELPLGHGEFLDFQNSNHFQNLIALHAGIGTVIFALFIFVAESFRDSSERGRVLLKESFLYPLTILEIMTFLVFLWWNVSPYIVLTTLTIAILTMISVYRVIKVLLDKPLFIKKRNALLKDRVTISINDALKIRIGNNILLKELEEDAYNIDLFFFREDREQGNLLIKLSKIGVVTDIDVCKMFDLFERLEDLANEKQLTFKTDKTSKTPDPESLLATQEYTQTQSQFRRSTKAFITKKLGDSLTVEDQHVLILPQVLVQNKQIENELRSIANAIYTITPENSIKEDLRIELGERKDVAIAAIHEGKINALKEVANTYVAAVEAFLEVIESVGGGYSQEEARKERGSLFGRWDEVNWVSSDLYDLLGEAIKTENKDIIEELTFVPVRIAISAIKISDHFVFQEFIRFHYFLYHSSSSVKNDEIKKLLIDTSWRHLKEIVDYYISSELDNVNRSEKEITNYKDFGVDIMQIYLILLKQSFDKQDISSFRQYHNALIDLFKYFKPSEKNMDSRDYKRLLNNPKLTTEQKEEYEEILTRQELLENVEEEINKRRQELVFGLSEWILHKYITSDLEDQHIKEFWDLIKNSLPEDFKEWTELYLSIDEGNEFWGWRWWGLENQPEGVATWADTSGRQNWLYCIKSLEILSTKSDQQILDIQIAPTRDIVYLAEKDDSPLKSILAQVEQNKTKWQRILSEEAISKTSLLKKFLDNIISKQKAKEDEKLISSPIDEEKKRKFINEFITEFHENASIRQLFRLFEQYKEFKQKNKEDLPLWGLNQIDDKAVFIKDWHVSYARWGENYGRGIAQSENLKVVREVFDKLPEIRQEDSDLNKALSSGLELLKQKGFTASAIVTNYDSWEWHRTSLQGWEFIPKYQIQEGKYKNLSGLSGLLKRGRKQLPVIEATFPNESHSESIICFVDMKKLAKFIQYPATSKKLESTEQNDIFLTKISDLNSDDVARGKIIRQNPSWLSQYNDPIYYLRHKALIILLERYEIAISSLEAGIKIIIKEY